jgi:hypothetical protein
MMFSIEVFANTVKAAREAIQFRIERKQRGFFYFPLEFHEKLAVVLSTLPPRELRKWILIHSSYQYGSYIFDQAFPAFANPEQFNSTPLEIDLSDRPVQVLGWKEVKALKQEGVSTGLNRDWIDIGFNKRAENRGIDLEWHFFAEPPSRADQFFPDGLNK